MKQDEKNLDFIFWSYRPALADCNALKVDFNFRYDICQTFTLLRTYMETYFNLTVQSAGAYCWSVPYKTATAVEKHILRCVNSMVWVWLCLGKNTTW